MSEIINNRENRIRTLKEIILHLHRGQPTDEVKAQLAEIVGSTDATEIAAMEQQLMADGMSVDEVQSMCDLHSEVLRDVIRPQMPQPLLSAGHPVETFRRENQAVRRTVENLRAAFKTALALPDDADPGDLLQPCRESANMLFDLEKHYQRKENLLFPFLEKHGVTGPSKVMWAKDDEVRAKLKGVEQALRAHGAAVAEWRVVFEAVVEPALAAVEEMIFKEEQILLPMALDTLSADEWGQIYLESPRIGWCIVEPGSGYRPPEPATQAETVEIPRGKAVVFPHGSLTRDQLMGMFAALPVDLTFVDADDRVAFFSEGPDRIFSRSRAIIGRKVQHCHPPRSVDVVERILDDMRAGRQKAAEFWIEFHGRFVHIRYFAVHDSAGKYIGCLEVTQDVTKIRELEGERRLLQYDDAPAA